MGRDWGGVVAKREMTKFGVVWRKGGLCGEVAMDLKLRRAEQARHDILAIGMGLLRVSHSFTR